jgi:type I restriction enzyme S subunit
MKWLVRTPAWWGQIDKFMNVGAVFNSLKCADVPNFELPIPPMEVQQEMCVLLDAIDDRIELNRRMNETLEAMARAMFKDWFVDFGPTRAKAEGRAPYLAPEIWNLFPDAFDDEDKPVGWLCHPACDLFEFNPRESVKKGTNAPYLDMAALPTIGAVPDAPTRREYKSGSKFRDGDTLFARITPCLENGKTAYVFGLGDDVIGAGSTEFIVIRSRAPLPQSAGYLLARDPEFRAHAERSMTGTSGRQRANAESLSRYEITAPDDDGIWKALGDLIDPMMTKVIANAYESRTLTQTRALLLPTLMSGEIRLREAEQAVEAVV